VYNGYIRYSGLRYIYIPRLNVAAVENFIQFLGADEKLMWGLERVKTDNLDDELSMSLVFKLTLSETLVPTSFST
jgi:hypothetical protein